MPEKSRRDAPPSDQPTSEEVGFDLDHALESIVGIRSTIPPDAFTAPILGVERGGSGIVIRESGLVLTIGYLITEAESVWLTSADGRVTPAHALAYDQTTGFGLVQALDRLGLPALPLGRSSAAKTGDSVVVAGGAGRSVRASIIGKQEFAGYWEYLLDEAIFTAPAHPFWGGAAVIGADGKLVGVGSLHIQQEGEQVGRRDINMIVPIDLLAPVLDDLLAHGRVNKPPRPWLGLYSADVEGRVVVINVADDGPAAAAGLREGDIITAVRDSSVEGLADFYRKVWACGPAGVEIAIEIVRNRRSMWVRLKSTDRDAALKKPPMH
jgi:S1-C subfamily serine protease